MMPPFAPRAQVVARVVEPPSISSTSSTTTFSTRSTPSVVRDAPETIRTSDLSLRRAALYPLSYGRRAKGQCSLILPRGWVLRHSS